MVTLNFGMFCSFSQFSYFNHRYNSEFIDPLLGCFWNLWVTVDNLSMQTNFV